MLYSKQIEGMNFFSTIRNSINGTTHFFQRDVKGRWSFFALFMLVFGIIQILALIVFLFIYAALTDNTEFGIDGMLGNLATGQLQFVMQFISLYMVMFMVVMLKKAKGGKATELKFGDLFQGIPATTFIVYLTAVAISLIGMLYLSSQLDYYFFQNVGNGLVQKSFYVDEKWYLVLIKNLSVFLLRYLPAFVLGYYVVSVKEGKWRWEFIKTRFMQVLAIVAISIMFIGLYETIMEFISRSITGVLSQTLQNETIFIILAIGITFLFASIFNGVMGSLAYFSVHTDNDDGVDKKMTLKREDSDILDQ